MADTNSSRNYDRRSPRGNGNEPMPAATAYGVLVKKQSSAADAAPDKTLAAHEKNKVYSVYPVYFEVDRSTALPARDRVAEIGELLALGQLRLLARNSRGKSGQTGEGSLHFSPDQSGHAALRRGAANG